MPTRPVTRRAAKVAAPALVAVGLALTAAFGGFKTARPEPPQRYAVGETIDQSWFHTEVVRAYVGQASGQKDGIPALHVELRVENMTDEPSYSDPILTLGSRKGTAFVTKDWKHSKCMTVVADGKSRDLLGALVKRASGLNSYELPPHVPVTLDTQWTMFTYGERPRDIEVSLTGYERNETQFYDIPRYWTAIEQQQDRSVGGGVKDAKPRMIATVRVPLGASGFKPHPPKPTPTPTPSVTPTHRPTAKPGKPTAKPTPKPTRNHTKRPHHKHRRPR